MIARTVILQDPKACKQFDAGSNDLRLPNADFINAFNNNPNKAYDAREVISFSRDGNWFDIPEFGNYIPEQWLIFMEVT